MLNYLRLIRAVIFRKPPDKTKMTSEYVHTLSNEQKVEFYFKKVQHILHKQPYEYDKYPGDLNLSDVEPVLFECDSYEDMDSKLLVDQILTYAVSEVVQALIFETHKENLVLYVVSGNEIVTEKPYHRLLRTKIISRLKRLTGVDPSEKKQPQVGILKVHYRQNDFNIKVLFFPQMLGESIVILPNEL